MAAIEWTIARRYLISREHGTLLSAIAVIATAGVAIGVAALISVVSVMDGALALFSRNFTNLYPQIKIQTHSQEEMIVPAALMQKLAANSEILAAVPVRARVGFIQSDRGVEAEKKGVQIIALEPDEIQQLYPGLRSADGKPFVLGDREILIGKPLAFELGCEMGGRTRVLGGERLRSVPFRVSALFDSGYYEFDANCVFINRTTMAMLFPPPAGADPAKVADYIHVRLQDPNRAEQVRNALELDLQYLVGTWQEDNNGMYLASIKIQKAGLFIILLLITLVAAFNIIGTLILMVIEKTREIGILRALGASRGTITRIFLFQGVFIGATGTTAGVVIGLSICALLRVAPIHLPPSVYNFSALPVYVSPLSVVVVAGSSMLICTLASLLPSRGAGRLNPVEALRYD